MRDDEIVRVPIEDAIDLHAFQARDILSVVDDYLQAASEKGLSLVRLIHGRGKGVQRAAIRRLLTAHPLVEDFWDAAEAHLGATMVRLKRPPDPPTSVPSP
jgi:DNA-nicking Smr family endonuclease